MSDWIARYEEGYITVNGESVTLTDEYHTEHPWQSPAEAQARWAKRADLTSCDVTTYGNGLRQTDDVRTWPAFAALGVVAIWRQVSFQAFNAT